ncbi:hypothetical protein DEU56DRAFT_772875 [Suillus clintonianus]|uniref:uncharacterized protein n=1 Tax=Suillus clintonianus TaxID=1904413 RepID=UPI001B861D3F|nr:uncharacterized protein DEU56DRAFT_772875 [Suillus clintonianus]KAG2154087.1 hypothetical protein DEU56DRAFT_772875 [Suillus clintonianus]
MPTTCSMKTKMCRPMLSHHFPVFPAASSYQYETHTHAPASSILYHIGKGALKGTNSRALELSNANARHWITLTAPQVKQKLPRLKISGGRITKA